METCIRELTPRLIRYCRARTCDFALAEEIAQESLASLIMRWRRHGPPDFIDAFVFSTARRRAWRASARRRLWVPIETLIGKTYNHADPEAQTIHRNHQEHLFAALKRLPAHQREALLLVAVADLSVDRAARTLGISQSALKVRIFRARRRLAALLEKQDGRKS
jgi:RNA polymerase sigma-70 factor (ECF subfamily)